MYIYLLCEYLIKCKICVITITIAIIYKIIYLLIKFIVSTINIYISEPHCSDTARKYPDRSFNSIQSIQCSSKQILPKETLLYTLTIQSVHRKE
jgi:hypothetical protein